MEPINVLLVGSGGREHALAWAIKQSPLCRELYCAPGSNAISKIALCYPVPVSDLDEMVRLALSIEADLVVIGPEAPLCAGLADRLRAVGIAVFGPDKAAAEIEGSKAFAKEFMERSDIPTARFRVFHDLMLARRFIEDLKPEWFPIVVKASGLAAGKGVRTCDTSGKAIQVAEGMLSGRLLGEAGRTIVIEEGLSGREVSFFVLSDGERCCEFGTAADYKRVGDGDQGPNTGGMGAYSPASTGESTRLFVMDRIVRPTLKGLADEGRSYRGVLYVGLMFTSNGPKVLEFNARFGDPETQVLVPRLAEDLLKLMYQCACGKLPDRGPVQKNQTAVGVVMASEGYPDKPRTGDLIEGLERVEQMLNVKVFHAGTAMDDDQEFMTAGGRVLCVSAHSDQIEKARLLAYEAVRLISWRGAYHRTDIAKGVF